MRMLVCFKLYIARFYADSWERAKDGPGQQLIIRIQDQDACLAFTVILDQTPDRALVLPAGGQSAGVQEMIIFKVPCRLKALS